ncbi:MAG: amidohydrolase family protein [Ostreibacterium sp.]
MQRLIDAHHHLWQLNGDINYPWLTDDIVADFFLGDYAPIRCTFTVDTLQKMLPRGYELIASIHCEAEASRQDAYQEACWIDQLQQQTKLPSAQSVWVDFMAKDVAQQLARMGALKTVRGVRWKPQTASCAEQAHLAGLGSFADDSWQQALMAMSAQALLWELRVPAWHLSEAATYLRAFAHLRVVVNHCGLPWDRTDAGLQQWREGLQALADNPNVAIKLSELGCSGRLQDKVENHRLLASILSIFGPFRCLFASNMPVSGLQVSYSSWLEQVERAISHICPYNKDDVLWRNALRWYRLVL